MSDSTESFRKSKDELSMSMSQLLDISECLERIGNNTLSSELREIALLSKFNLKVMNDEYSNQIFDRFNDAKQHSANLLCLALKQSEETA